MNDLISRQATIDAIREMSPELFSAYQHNAYVDKQAVMVRLMALPSVQPEQEKGKWIYGEHDIAMCDGYRCDQCGFFVPWDYKHKFIDFIKDYHWCPSCGADMREESEVEE